MFQFPDGLYTDVRVEDVFESKIQITLKNLENMKEQSYKAAFIRVFDGGRWYYAATTSSDNVQGEIDRLATKATKNHSIADHPGIACLEVNQGEYFRFNDTKSVRNISKNDKLNDLKIYEILIDGKPYVTMWRLNYLDQNVKKSFYSSKGADLHWDYQRVGFRLSFKLAEGKRTFEDWIDCAGNIYTEIQQTDETILESYTEAVKFLLEAQEFESGSYPVVLSPEAAGIFAHESFGHKSEADFMVSDETMKKEWVIGKKVGADLLSIVDDGNNIGIGFVPYDDEGSKARKTYLIKNGFLSGRLHSSVTAADLGEELTGNARAVNFEFEPIVRMTTTYIEPGSLSFDDLLQPVKKGVYIETLKHGSGMSTFTLAPCRAYLIEGGKITKRLKISFVSGTVFQTLNDIDGISDKLKLGAPILGGCGKMEQRSLPVGWGGPYVRVKSLDVG